MKYEKYRDFKGNLNELISIIKETLIDLNLYDASLKYDRLIRYYIQEELLPRPSREGKDFFYDYRHLVRFLYTRKQIKDGWPINKLKETTKYENDEYFEEFLYPNNTSLGLISEFKMNAKIPSSSYDNYERKKIPNTKVALQNINSDISNVIKQELTSLELSTNLKLLIDTKLLSAMDYDLANKIGEAISSSLVERKPMLVDEFKKVLSDYKNYKNQEELINKLQKEIEFLRSKFEESKKDFEDEIHNFKVIQDQEKTVLHSKYKDELNVVRETGEKQIKSLASENEMLRANLEAFKKKIDFKK